MKYHEYLDQEPDMDALGVFFAFSNEQLAEGLKKHNPNQDKKYLKFDYGMFATKEGYQQVHEFYANRSKEIIENCTPQEVYNYEFVNHECDWEGDDDEAIIIVLDYFGIERTKEVKRKHGYTDLEQLVNT